MASKIEKKALALRAKMGQISEYLVDIQSDLEDLASDLEDEIQGLVSEDDPDALSIEELENMLTNVKAWIEACEDAQEKLDV